MYKKKYKKRIKELEEQIKSVQQRGSNETQLIILGNRYIPLLKQ